MVIKEKHIIDFCKGITWFIVLGLISYFNQWNNLTAWIYLILHGSYGLMWVMKSQIFPDKTWEKPVKFSYGILIFVGLCAYWIPAYIITSESHMASIPILFGAIICFIFGVWYHFVSDMQKFTFLKYQKGLIKDGLWSHCRHPNYFGEFLIYFSFVLMSIEAVMWWIPVVILNIFIAFVWYPNMRKIELSLSRFEDHKDYKKQTSFFFPFL